MAINLLLLKNYNNYFNKIVRRKETIEEYKNVVEDYFEVASVNFNPNDGVNTSQVVGSGSKPYTPTWNPDYVVVYNTETLEIISRWFVTESVRNMINQYTLALKRDVCADFYEEIIYQPCYIEKATLEDDDPMVVNNEGISFNQIKTAEYYLKDETKIPWVVAYLKQKRETDYSGDNKIQADCYDFIESTDVTDNEEFKKIFPNASTGTLEENRRVFMNNKSFSFEIDYGAHIGLLFCRRKVLKTKFDSSIQFFQDVVNGNVYIMDGIDGFTYTTIINKQFHDYLYDGHDELSTMFKNMMNNIKTDFKSFINPYYTSKKCTDLYSTFSLNYEQFKNKILKLKVNGVYKYFKLLVQEMDELNIKDLVTDSSMTSNFDEQFNKVKTGDWEINTHYSHQRGIIRFNCIVKNLHFKLTELLSTKIFTEIPKEAYQTQGVPYDVVAFPMFDTKMKNYTTDDIECNGSAGINIVRAMAKQMGEFFIDAQILPFCPFPECLTNGYIDYSKTHKSPVGSILVKEVDDTSKILSIGIIATYPMRHLEIENVGTSIYNDNEVSCSDLLTITNRKINSNCDLFRLCSPNYASQFEFNLAKCTPLQSGSIVSMTKFKVDVTFRPFNPYIHVFPDYSFLYGQDFEDSRGLICSGDFGITTLSNAWVNYMNNNKNYQNMFDRGIKKMEVDRGFARERENWNIAGGALGIAGIGMGMGVADLSSKGLSDIGMGAGIAGLVGGAVGLAKKIRDKQLNEQQYQENVKYSTDMFNMQMDNIKAMPDSITHTSALTNNFKFYPILEFYTCTEEEKEALKSKMKYNGMTVGRIDYIYKYLSTEEERFIKGQMIRLEYIGDDSHIAMEIYNEINGGKFFEATEEEE